jgi:spore coat protein A, manganese oxidase
MPSRRDFLRTGAVAGAGALLAKGGLEKAVAAGNPGAGGAAIAATPPLTKWLDPLTSAIPLAQPLAPNSYKISMVPGRHKFHSGLPVTSTRKYTTWGYKDEVSGATFEYLGPTIEAQSLTPTTVTFINNLPEFHPIQQSIDPTVPDAEMYGWMPGGRATPHLHGGFTAPEFDGHPHSWWTAKDDPEVGRRCLPKVVKGQRTFTFSNKQPAAMLWYHDHAMGITRLNVYAGLAGLYFIRDGQDTGASGNPLNLPAGPYEIPLVIQDKTFNLDGSLWYPILGVTPVHPMWMPEFFGDTPVVNGTCYPYLNVEPRKYRFRIVNGSQARFYNLWITAPNKGNLPLTQIGAEQSLLPNPYLLPGGTFLLSPGERADIIADFKGLPVGTVLTMKNNANAPYPGGNNGIAIPEIMQFRVVAGAADTLVIPPTLTTIEPLTGNAKTREIVMKETAAPTGAGNQVAPTDMKLNGWWFDEPIGGTGANKNNLLIEESPRLNDVETWQYINLTVDAHPMHSHLVKFKVVKRNTFNVAAFTTAWNAYILGGRNTAKPTLATAGLPLGPDIMPTGDEAGWKDTAKAYPGQVLTVQAKYEIPPGVTIDANHPPAEYVYHCHILEHEENEMMRPFVVTWDGNPPTNVPNGMYKVGEEAPPSSNLPAEFALDQNYPNPFNPETTIRFHLPADTNVQLKVFNNIGQEVATLADGQLTAGSHSLKFNASNLASGVYYAKIQAGTFTATQKMLLMK